MGDWSRDELERAFAHYREVAARAASSGEWRPWADLFTEDATYIEHHYGEFKGRDAIYDWIQSTMHDGANNDMQAFPSEWWVIDEERGWIVCAIANVMNDPGDGSQHQAVNWTLLKYAGDDQWSWEEDLYNPNEFLEMMKGWHKAKKAAAS
jgi:hypothetical protein